MLPVAYRCSRAGLLVAMVVFVGSCTAPADPDMGRYVATGRPIINGTPDTSQAHMAVVALTYGPGSGAFCTGTLIASNVVLTAAHCLENVQQQWLQVFFGNDVDGVGEYRGVSELLPYPYYNSSTMDGDIGLIRLSSVAPASITPIPALPASSGLTSADVGLQVDFSGFGVTELNTDGVKLHVGGAIGYVCNQTSACQGYIAPYGFEYEQSGGGPCSGDSGGPAFIWRGGTEYVAGVTSYGDPQCTQYGVSTMVDAYSSWIASFLGVGSEICDNGVDDDGDGQVDCADPDCDFSSECQGPDACEAAGSLTCGASVSGTTVGGAVAFSSYGCLNQDTEDGPEVAYELSIAAGTQVTATMTPTGGGDLDLFLLPAAGASCSPSGCIDASLNGDNSPETLVFSVPSGGAFLLVETYNTPSTYTLSLVCDGQGELCDNGVDDDGDGAVDCADTDCVSNYACAGPEEICDNGVDDDGDGAVDCADMTCAGAPACAGSQEICSNHADDDGDGAIDCADPDCVSSAYCQAGRELCANGIDDDGDGAADCDDGDCDTAPGCSDTGPSLAQSGCGCAQSGPGNAPFGAALLALLLLGVLRRKGGH